MQNITSKLEHVMYRRRPVGGADDTHQPPQKHLPTLTALYRHQRKGPIPLLVLLTATLATDFYRFLARFSGRRRTWPLITLNSRPPWALLVLAATSLIHLADSCSSRTTPKPRPPTPTQRSNVTFHTYICPPAYDTWYCLNGATCFTVKIEESLLYNCECADGYMGPRCEYKDLDGSYLPSQRRYMLETASIASGATIAVFLVVILCVVVYVHIKRKAKQTRVKSADCVDSSTATIQRLPTFGTKHKQHQYYQDITRSNVPLSLNDRGDGRTVLVTASKEQLQQATTLLPCSDKIAGDNLA